MLNTKPLVKKYALSGELSETVGLVDYYLLRHDDSLEEKWYVRDRWNDTYEQLTHVHLYELYEQLLNDYSI